MIPIDNPRLIVSRDTDNKPEKDCDCSGGDCACSLPNTYSRQDILFSVGLSLDTIKYMVSPASQSLRLDEENVVCYGPYHSVAVLNNSAFHLLSAFNYPSTIKQIIVQNNLSNTFMSIIKVIQQLIEFNLLVHEDYSYVQPPSPKILTSWLHITDRCNLRCAYCYLPHIRRDMSSTIGKAAIDATFRSALKHKHQTVKLKYAGGEPLVRFPLITELHNYAKSIAARSNIALSEVILTNGTLITEEIAKTIFSLDMKMMISLDGLDEYHDRQRPYAGGGSTVDDVLRGINLALANGVAPHISITISGQNIKSLPDLLTWLIDRNLSFSLNFYRENPLSISRKELVLEEQQIIHGMLNAYQIIEKNLPKRSLLSSIVDRADLSGSHTHTCGVGINYLVFDYEGRVSKCQMHLHHAITSIKELDPLGVIQLDSSGLQNLPVEEKEGCRNCEWKYWCTGGCSLNTFKSTGRYDVKSPNCNIYKSIYPEAIRLEGLRLLKYFS